MPIRTVEMDDNLRIWRTFSIGDLFDLIMLDTRQYDRSITDIYTNTGYIHNVSYFSVLKKTSLTCYRSPMMLVAP